MDWFLKIEKVDNGYVLITNGDGEGPESRMALQEDGEDPMKVNEEVLWEVMDHFNMSGSKHDKERLRVTRQKQ